MGCHWEEKLELRREISYPRHLPTMGFEPAPAASERHYLLGGASRRLGASLNHLPDWPTGEHGPGPGGPRVVRFIAMFEEF